MMKFKHRMLLLLLAACLSLSCLSGCGAHKHTWVLATCTEPRTCSECGEMEGDPLGHDYAAATCTEPTTCVVCGKTKGQPKGHLMKAATCAQPATCSICGYTEGETQEHTWQAATCTEPAICAVCGAQSEEYGAHQWTAANYQAPATCSLCGATDGEPLTPAFVEYKVPGHFIEQGKTYEYRTVCYVDPTVETVGALTITSYKVLESDETHAAKEGYEWRIAAAELVFGDETSWNYGYSYHTCTENYYDIVGTDDSIRYDPDNSSVTYYNVNWKGQDYECMKRFYSASDGWSDDGRATIIVSTAWLVPKGYDGCILGFYNAGNEWGDGEYIFDVADADTLFFRLQ